MKTRFNNSGTSLHVAIIRANESTFDGRLKRILSTYNELDVKIHLIDWYRKPSADRDSSGHPISNNSFSMEAPYGRAGRNLFAQIRWQLWQLSRILAIRPRFIHACDLDSLFVPTLYKYLGALFGKRICLVYDQFDEFSSRFSSVPIATFFGACDRFCGKLADIQIVSSDSRVSSGNEIVIGNFPILEVPMNNDIQIIKTRNYDVMYLGIFAKDRGLLQLMNLARENPELQIYLAGVGDLTEVLEGYDLNLPNVTVGPSFEGDMEYINLATNSKVIFAFYDPQKANNRRTASTKLALSAYSYTPVITNRGIDLSKQVEKYGLGVSVDFSNEVEFKNAVCRILDMYQEESFRSNCLFYIHKIAKDTQYSRSVFLQKLGACHEV